MTVTIKIDEIIKYSNKLRNHFAIIKKKCTFVFH